MTQPVPVFKTGELPEGAMKKVTHNGKEILVACVRGKFYAMADRCGHAGGDLSLGKIEGTVVTCPRHGSQWDVTDGHNVRWTRNPDAVPKIKQLASYPVKVEGDSVLLQI